MPKEFSSYAKFDLDGFPAVENQRKIYVKSLPKETADELTSRGYQLVYVNTLPRDTPEQDQEYLRAIARGVEECTISMNEMQFKALDAELKIHNMVGAKSMSLNVEAKLDKEDLDALLDWKPSRHSTSIDTPIKLLGGKNGDK